jgi:hypothetical protein
MHSSIDWVLKIAVGAAALMIFVAAFSTFAAFYDPTPTRYEVTCVNERGQMIYHDKAKFYPSIYRTRGTVCVVRGE